MSDAYYQERAKRRNRLLLLAAALAVVALLIFLGIRALFYDACTGSFERSPEAVVRTYVEAVSRGDAPTAQECWEHQTYYNLEAGCSEICLSRAYGAPYKIIDLAVVEPYTTEDGRANLQATVSVACTTGGGETYSGEITLDSVSGNVPWKHWQIVHSTVGGTVAESWCK
jgi:hypothetical protein